MHKWGKNHVAIDIRGNEVKVGSRVKVLTINPAVWECLPDEEQNDLGSMIGEVFEVYEVADKYASVEKLNAWLGWAGGGLDKT